MSNDLQQARVETAEQVVADALGLDYYTPGVARIAVAALRDAGMLAEVELKAAERVTPTREQVAEVLRGIGLTDVPEEYDSGIHSWRCRYPDVYGRCPCFDRAVDDIMALMTAEGEGDDD